MPSNAQLHKRGRGASAEQTSDTSKERPNGKAKGASKTPVHVTVGVSAFIGLVVVGSHYWWQQGSQSSASRARAPVDIPPATPLWVSADVLPERVVANVSCTKLTKETGRNGACNDPRATNRCARFVIDGAIPESESLELKNMLQWLIDQAWGAGSGPPSVVDLHQGSISYKDKFVDLAALMNFKSIKFTDAQIKAYDRVRRATRRAVAQLFGLPQDDLLYDLTFFSHINASKVPQTLHDEYWHQHMDTEQYGTFAYTTLLYLSTVHEDFEGGSFVFDDESGSTAVAPRFGRLVVFTSDAENPHRVEHVTKGTRIALTSAFTCNSEKAKSIDVFPDNFIKRWEEAAAAKASG